MTTDWPTRLAPGAPGAIEHVPPTGAADAAEAEALAPELARVVSLAGPMSKADLLDAIAAGLDFPEWFGRNWDALEELLRAPQPPDDRAIVLVWHDPEALPPTDSAMARRIFREVAHGRRRAGRRPLLVQVVDRRPSDATPEETPMHAPIDDLPDTLRRIGRVHHVALIVRSVDDATRFWRDFLGLALETVMDIPRDGVRIAFLSVGESKVELVQPTDASTGVARFLAANGEGFHHVCFEVPDVAAALAALAAQGIELIDATPRPGADGPVAFLHPRSCHGVLVELIEAPGGPAWATLEG